MVHGSHQVLLLITFMAIVAVSSTQTWPQMEICLPNFDLKNLTNKQNCPLFKSKDGSSLYLPIVYHSPSRVKNYTGLVHHCKESDMSSTPTLAMSKCTKRIYSTISCYKNSDFEKSQDENCSFEHIFATFLNSKVLFANLKSLDNDTHLDSCHDDHQCISTTCDDKWIEHSKDADPHEVDEVLYRCHNRYDPVLFKDPAGPGFVIFTNADCAYCNGYDFGLKKLDTVDIAMAPILHRHPDMVTQHMYRLKIDKVNKKHYEEASKVQTEIEILPTDVSLTKITVLCVLILLTLIELSFCIFRTYFINFLARLRALLEKTPVADSKANNLISSL